MTEVSFYHLQSEPIERALPRLLEKVRERGFRVLVRGATEERIETLDEALWTYRDASFLAHGRAGDALDPAEQPIFLTLETEGNANGATILVLTEDAAADDATAFERCLYMFDGNDDAALKAARGRWKSLKDRNIPVSYYQQTENGWEKKA
ncbi:MAG: DNA polymerase III subunit chi [Sneathiella sp.]|uniref:DNA polymerase III subunit chi n=1 Tax=Sneathiella sp. TaxID=1964365 RepID=UPI000C69442B|nr:DNA polymerase III subunit chi [Sneathiella sp.]MAZ01903.1 DNA polymerase III subunit chi [Sneathiella sp.]